MSWYFRLHARRPHHFLLNYNMWLPWRLHKWSQPAKPITVHHFGPCKWQPPWPQFASALVTDWYQYHGWPPCMRAVSLYKRASPPSPWLTFGWTWPQSHLDLELDSSPGHSPDCWFTLHSLVNFSFRLQLTSVSPLTSSSLVTECKP